MMKVLKHLTFLWIPIFYLFFALLTQFELDKFYYSWFDPAYAYLLNGLTFATGSFDIGHIDHPGTPMQLFCALIIKAVALLTGTKNITVDVLTNPEYYLRIISFCTSALVAASLIYLGYSAQKATNNRYIALLIQASPLLSLKAVYFSPIVATEPLITVISIGLVSFMLRLMRSQKAGTYRGTVILALLSGLLIATKISALPILALPFFFQEGRKPKTTYFLSTIIFTIVFVSPVLSKMSGFLHFIERIFTHQGSYGTGEAKIMDWGIYFGSLWKIVTQELPFTLHLLFLGAAWIVVARNKHLPPSWKRTLTALTLATILSLLIVARQYSFHYLIPIYVVAMPLQFYLWYSVLKKKNIVNMRYFQGIVLIFLLLIFVRLYVNFHFFPEFKNPVNETKNETEQNFRGTYIIVNNGNPGAFIQPALHFGLAYTGNTKKEIYQKIVAEKYRENYVWNKETGFSDWNQKLVGTQLFSSYDSIYIYCRSVNTESAVSEIETLFALNNLQSYCSRSTVYLNQQTGEAITLSVNDTAAIRKKSLPAETIQFDMEQRTPDNSRFVSTEGKYFLSSGNNQSQTHAYAGNFSVQMQNADSYSLNISLPVMQGESFRVNAWQRSAGGNIAYLVASAPNSQNFYTSSVETKTKAGEWNKTELIFQIPASNNDTTINLYFWLPVNDTVWIDALEIQRFRH